MASNNPLHVAGSMSIDELSRASGLSVRTVRYYLTRGLLPAPDREGRRKVFGRRHRHRLQQVRALLSHGLTLQAIQDGFLTERVPCDALGASHALIAVWTADQWSPIDRRDLERSAAGSLDESAIEWLVASRALRPGQASEFEASDAIDAALELHTLGIPLDVIVAANTAAQRSVERLTADLTALWEVGELGSTGLDFEESGSFDQVQALHALRTATLIAIAVTFERTVVARYRRMMPPPTDPD
ncbi:MAG: helix-turn-helix domain-containing protein [Propionibacteriales bacterium]|nr:helix-turn-helix domain-containing protein [Propionibacteriales bacterium]